MGWNLWCKNKNIGSGLLALSPQKKTETRIRPIPAQSMVFWVSEAWENAYPWSLCPFVFCEAEWNRTWAYFLIGDGPGYQIPGKKIREGLL